MTQSNQATPENFYPHSEQNIPKAKKPRSFSALWIVIGIFHLLVGVLFLLQPNAIYHFLNFFPHVFNLYESIEITQIDWISLGFTCAFFSYTSFLCFFVAFKRKNSHYSLLLSLSKLTTALLFFYLFFKVKPLFGLLLFAVIDSLLFLILITRMISQQIKKKMSKA